MASNTLPSNSGALIQLGKEMLAGLTSLGSSLKIVLITPEQLQADITAFASADNAYNAGRSAQQSASDDFHAADDAISSWLGTVRGVLLNSFGRFWNTQWVQAGFVNGSTAVPPKIDDRLSLCGRLVAFFTASPSYEVPALDVTAAQGTTLESTAQTTKQAWAAAGQALSTIGVTWTATNAALTDDMWSLIKILQATLDDDDPRWLAFGLQMPSTITTPGQPQNVFAHLDQTGAIIVQCDAVPTATRYRWRTMVVGVQSDYQLAASTPGPMSSLSGFVPGQVVQIIVQAVNGNLQGVASDPIVFTVPLPVTVTVSGRVEKAAAAEPKHAEAPAVSANGHSNGLSANVSSNGNGNGRNAHAAHSRVLT